MSTPAQPVHLKWIFIIGAIVVFILAALFLFGVGNVKEATSLGLIAVGLAALAAASITP